MSGTENKGKGKNFQWLLDHLSYAGEDCLLWPFAKDSGVGRGRIGHNGISYWTHRLMCELVNGPPPTPKHHAAHNCGNGHLGCVDPRHLQWKTVSENALDRVRHGKKADPGSWGAGKLTRVLANEIKAKKGLKTQFELAREYNVSDSTIRNIHAGRIWKDHSLRRPNPITPQQIAQVISMRKARVDEITKITGVGRSSVYKILNTRSDLCPD